MSRRDSFRRACTGMAIPLMALWVVSCFTAVCVGNAHGYLGFIDGGLVLSNDPDALHSAGAGKSPSGNLLLTDAHWMPHVAKWGPSVKITHGKVWRVILPIWLPTVAFGVPAFFLWREYLVARSKNCCPDCGYSRQGIARGALCPECGAAANEQPV